MAEPRPVVPVLLVIALFGRHPEALAWAIDRVEAEFGPVALACPTYDFEQTGYYERTMGPGLRKRLLAFHRLIGPEQLAAQKLITNALEAELAATGRFAEARPINLDPGTLSLGKLVLATTKDQAQRVYLRDGIYAEVTLRFEDGAFIAWPWTYADYRLPRVRAFLGEARRLYRERLRGGVGQ